MQDHLFEAHKALRRAAREAEPLEAELIKAVRLLLDLVRLDVQSAAKEGVDMGKDMREHEGSLIREHVPLCNRPPADAHKLVGRNRELAQWIRDNGDTAWNKESDEWWDRIRVGKEVTFLVKRDIADDALIEVHVGAGLPPAGGLEESLPPPMGDVPYGAEAASPRADRRSLLRRLLDVVRRSRPGE